MGSRSKLQAIEGMYPACFRETQLFSKIYATIVNQERKNKRKQNKKEEKARQCSISYTM